MASSVAVRSVATWVPAGMVRSLSNAAARRKSTSTEAADGPSNDSPIISRNLR